MLAHKNRGEIVKILQDQIMAHTSGVVCRILLWLQAIDLESKIDATEIHPPLFYSFKFGQAAFKEQFDHYRDIFYVSDYGSPFADLVSRQLEPFSDLFANYNFVFLKEQAIQRVREQWPDISI